MAIWHYKPVRRSPLEHIWRMFYDGSEWGLCHSSSKKSPI